MKVRGLLAIMLVLSVGALQAQPQASKKVTCKNIKRKDAESFVSRVSCARDEIRAGNDEQAFVLMAPIYKDAKTGKSNTSVDSEDKLGDIVRLKLGESADGLIRQFGATDVYAAVADTLSINPMKGTKATKKQTMLPEALVNNVRAALEYGPALPPEEVPTPAERPIPAPMPEEVMPKPSAPPAPVSEQERGALAKKQLDADVKLFAVNSVLDRLFVIAALKDDYALCQNLTDAVMNGKSASAMIKAAKAGDDEKIYASLKSSFGAGWIMGKRKAKSRDDLLEDWATMVASPKLIEELSKGGIASSTLMQQTQAYVMRQDAGTPQLRVSMAIDVMRGAYRALFDPVTGRAKVALPEDDRFADIADIYLAVNKGLLANAFVVSPDTQFKVMPVFASAGTMYTITALDSRLAEIVSTITNEDLISKKLPQATQSKLRTVLTTAARVGGRIALGAAIVYVGAYATGYEGVLPGGTFLVNQVGSLAVRVMGALGPVGETISNSASSAVSGVSSGASALVGSVASAGSSLLNGVKNLMTGGQAAVEAAAGTPTEEVLLPTLLPTVLPSPEATAALDAAARAAANAVTTAVGPTETVAAIVESGAGAAEVIAEVAPKANAFWRMFGY